LLHPGFFPDHASVSSASAFSIGHRPGSMVDYN
jgi:hypothetical protein